MSDTLKHLLTRIEWNKNVQSLTESEPDKPLTNRYSDIVWLPYTGIPTRMISELYDAGDSITDIPENITAHLL